MYVYMYMCLCKYIHVYVHPCSEVHVVKQLYKDFSTLKGEVDSCRETSVAALQREQRATSLVSELTAVSIGRGRDGV